MVNTGAVTSLLGLTASATRRSGKTWRPKKFDRGSRSSRGTSALSLEDSLGWQRSSVSRRPAPLPPSLTSSSYNRRGQPTITTRALTTPCERLPGKWRAVGSLSRSASRPGTLRQALGESAYGQAGPWLPAYRTRYSGRASLKPSSLVCRARAVYSSAPASPAGHQARP